MTRTISPLTAQHHDDLVGQLTNSIELGCRRASKAPLVFFRADDIAIPSRGFADFIEIFQKHKLPLCLATVPVWLTELRLAELRRVTGTGSSQWCWHQHGFTHRNFEASGKKQEFGPGRQTQELSRNLEQGRARLTRLLGEDFLPVFTPPWNRCSGATLQALTDLGFQAVSRSRGALPESPVELPDFQVNVDLHTRKEPSPQLAFAKILKELEEGLASGLCGIMIHHQRMNGRAFQLLDTLLDQIKSNQTIIPVHFGDLLKEKS